MLKILALSLLLPNCQEVQRGDEIEWPREFQVDGNSVVIFQPQLDEWRGGYESLVARAAVAVTQEGADRPAYGWIEIWAKTKTDFESRMVLLSGREILAVQFSNAAPELGQRLEAITRKALPPARQLTLPLDFLLANIERSKDQAETIAVNLEPPPIFRSEQPAILVMFMGEPGLEAIEGTDLMFVTNTNWDVFLDKSTGRYFLRNGAHWLTAENLTEGTWTSTAATPDDLRKLPADKNWQEVRKNLPGVEAKTVPLVFVATRPAELILTEGEAAFTPIPGSNLLYAKNTESDLFLLPGENNYYFLTAGRWFRSANLDGPWATATQDLPEEFKKIPADHPKGEVLASIPGTAAAQEAVIMASIPRKVTVDRSKATVTVVYQGDPKFIPIEGTSVYFAENSPQDVFQVGDAYYCCYQGIWFGAPRPTGPWVVCTEVPKAIYGIPATHPKHNVTYVYIYSSAPTTVVVGYTSGYVGGYVAYGTVMFGLGYWSSHYSYHHYHCHSHYYGYGSNAHYDHYSGTYYRGSSAYGPYGGAGRGAVYNPSTGTYSRGAYAYGPEGSRYARDAYNPHTGTYARQTGGSGPYGSWNNTTVNRGNQWARGGTRSDGNTTVGGFQTSRGAKGVGVSGPQGSAGAIKTRHGDVYAGKDGKVYKKSGDSWQQRGPSGWAKVDPPTRRAGTSRGDGSRTNPRSTNPRQPNRSATGRNTAGGSTTNRGLSRDSRARTRGNSNSRRFRSSSGSRRSSSGRSRSAGRSRGGRRR